MKQIIKGIKVYKIGHGGIGIGSLSDGKKILIKGGAIPGSVVDIKVVKRRKDYIEAHIVETKKYDPHFADGEIFCPHYFIPMGVSAVNEGTAKIGCGGCKWQMMSYPRQLELKQELIAESFKKVNAKIQNPPASHPPLQKGVISFLPILGSPLVQGYRNKIEFSFGVYIQQSSEYRQWEREQRVLMENPPLKGDEGGSNSKWTSPTPPSEGGLQKAPQKYIIESRKNCGFHKQGEFSKIVDVESCGLISHKANLMFEKIKELCMNSPLPVYDQKTHQGFFRHLVIREGVNTGQLMANLSVSLSNLSDKQTKEWEALLESFKADPLLQEGISTFLITYNEGLADTVKNDKSETKVFWGEGVIHETLSFWGEAEESTTLDASLHSAWQEGGAQEVTFRISPFSFFQTNTLGAQRLFSTAFKMLGNFEGNILDLYCGAGSIGLSLLKMKNREQEKSELIGIEIVEEAIIDAWHNAKINGLQDQSYFVASPAEKALANFPELEEKIRNVGVVVVDPPRDGLHKNVIEWIVNLKKEYNFKLLYISCNPVTMARDVEMFLEAGFSLKEIQPLDLFPHTYHCECVGVLG